MKRKRQEETRTWCNVCNLWIADNRLQREQHEFGTRHTTAYAKLIKDIAEKNKARRSAEQRKSSSSASAGIQTAGASYKSSAAFQFLEKAFASAQGAQLSAAKPAEPVEFAGCAQLQHNAKLTEPAEHAKTDERFEGLAIEADSNQKQEQKRDEQPGDPVKPVHLEANDELAHCQTDENGYPLAADDALGSWQPVVEEDAPNHSEYGGGHGEDADAVTAEAKEKHHHEVVGSSLNTAMAPAFENTFKKRMRATSKKKRRRTSEEC